MVSITISTLEETVYAIDIKTTKLNNALIITFISKKYFNSKDFFILGSIIIKPKHNKN
jgi:hypothetical protein